MYISNIRYAHEKWFNVNAASTASREESVEDEWFLFRSFSICSLHSCWFAAASAICGCDAQVNGCMCILHDTRTLNGF